MCAALVQQAKRAVKSKMTLAGSITGAMLVSAFLWADAEHTKVEQDCQARIDIECEKIDDVYAKREDVARIEETLEWLKDASEKQNALLERMSEQIDDLSSRRRKR